MILRASFSIDLLVGRMTSLTNCALSRTGLAAFVIGAGCDKMTCGAGAGALALGIEEYCTCELAVVPECERSAVLVL